MRFTDHTDSLSVKLETCGSIRFSETSTFGVRVNIHNKCEGYGAPTSACFILGADEAVKLARGLLKLALKAR